MPADAGEREEIAPPELDARLRRLDGGRHDLREWQPAEHLVGVTAPRDRPRHRDGVKAALGAIPHRERMAVVGRSARAVRLEHVGSRRERRARIGVEAQKSAAAGGMGGDASVAAESAHRRLDHEGGERGAHQGVERVPAFLHEAHPRVGHRRMPAGAHAAFRLDRRAGVDGLAAARALGQRCISSEQPAAERRTIVAHAAGRSPAFAASMIRQIRWIPGFAGMTVGGAPGCAVRAFIPAGMEEPRPPRLLWIHFIVRG